jgi:4-diphosphocytidyl-2-C-methyl-D-erythritol kinase
MLIVHAPAKVNLRLRILAREVSGYHQLETVFAALEFGDILCLSRTAGGVALTAEGPAMGPVEENLVYRAAAAFLERGGMDGGVELHLEKRVPVGGGLGGGSSDAAAALRGLQALFPGALTPEETLGIAGGLGSDVPFFLCGSPFALAWGRGDRLLPLPPPPPAPVLLAFPPVAVSTAEAYRLVARVRGNGHRANAARREVLRTDAPRLEGSGPGAPHPEEGRPGPPEVLPVDALSSWGRLSALAVNDFEEVILPAYPLLRRLREALQETHPRISLLSGSGASLFAVYGEEGEAAEGKGSLEKRFPQCRFVLTRTLGENAPEPLHHWM